jgi:CheY-like chemotaxis protein
MSDYMRASILVVDSNSESLFTMAAILIANHHQVQTARDASHALKMACQDSLDLLITDTRLIDKSGISLVREIRQFPDHADLPVMFVSTNQTPDVIRRTHDTGAAFHLKKPIDPTVLCELVDKALWLPHLVKSHVDQKTIKMPHVSFAKNPLASPFDTNSSTDSFIAGTPITF